MATVMTGFTEGLRLKTKPKDFAQEISPKTCTEVSEAQRLNHHYFKTSLKRQKSSNCYAQDPPAMVNNPPQLRVEREQQPKAP